MHLKQFEKQLKNRGQVRYSSSGSAQTNKDYPGQHHWLELDNNPSLEKLEDFAKRKIVFARIAGNEPCFAIDENGFLTNDTGYIITGENLDFLIQQLTSDILWYALKTFYMGGGIDREFKIANLLELPVPFEHSNFDLTEEEIEHIRKNTTP